jgi:site-specific DNA recombinase
MQTTPNRVSLSARVSTTDQTAENQILELRAYCAARGWTITAEYVDTGISGSTTSRPQLDAMISAARRRQVDAIVTWRLDRLDTDTGKQ